MNKHLTLSGLQTVLPPIKHLIDKKAENVDWNENDPSAKGYVKNRPFYSYEKIIKGEYFLEETTFTGEQQGDNFYIYPFSEDLLNFELLDRLFSSNSDLESAEFIVSYDNEIYKTKCVFPLNDINNPPFLGNLSLLDGGEDTGEPFVFAIWGQVGVTTPGEHTISVRVADSVVKEYVKIDPKFLPEVETALIVKGPDVTTYDMEFPKANKNAIEIYEAYAAGKQVYFQYADGTPFISLAASTPEQAIFVGEFVENLNTFAAIQYPIKQLAFQIDNEGYINDHPSSILTLSTQIDLKANSSTTINNKPLSKNITLTAADVGAATEGYVDTVAETIPTNLVNGSANGSLRSINASDSLGANSFSVGNQTEASGAAAHAEGYQSKAYGKYSHAEGNLTIAFGESSHAEGTSSATSIKITGSSNATTYTVNISNAPNYTGWIIKYNDHYARINSAIDNTIFVSQTLSADNLTEASAYIYPGASGPNSHSEGCITTSAGSYSHAEGYSTKSLGMISHAEGRSTLSEGGYSHAEGTSSKTFGEASHAEGSSTFAYGNNSHAEGKGGLRSFYVTAEGGVTEYTLLTAAHSELFPISVNHKILYKNNYYTITAVNGLAVTLTTTLSETALNSELIYLVDGAVGESSHSEGASNIAAGLSGHVEGTNNFANETNSHAEGSFTVADGKNQHVQGCGNLRDLEGKYAHIVGNGSFNGSIQKLTRSNAHTLDWNGNAWYQGDVYVGGSGQDDAAAKKLATEEFVAAPRSSLTLVDQVTGENYIVCIRNGSLVTYKAE